MIIWISKYAKYIDVNITKGVYRYIIFCEDNYVLTEIKNILGELNINFSFTERCIMINHRNYNFDKIGGINIFIDQCKNIINHKYQIKRIENELTILNLK